MGDPFEDIKHSGLEDTNFLYWIVLMIMLLGLLLGSVIYNETKGSSDSTPAPTEDHHHGPGGEEGPVIPF